MEEKILEIMNSVFQTNGLGTDCSQSNCEKWDSLHHLNLIVELEEAFDVEFEPEEIADMKDFTAVREIVKSKIA